MKTNHYAGIDPHIVKVIERESARLRGRFGIGEADLADIRQDLHIGVWKALGTLVPDVNPEAAVNRIVGNLIRDLIRHRQRECRDWRREVVSIHAPHDWPDEHDDESLGDAEDLEARSRAASGMHPSWHERRAEAVDVADALRRLSCDLRSLADALDAADGNLSEAARLLNLPRKKARLMFSRMAVRMEGTCGAKEKRFPVRCSESPQATGPVRARRGRHALPLQGIQLAPFPAGRNEPHLPAAGTCSEVNSGAGCFN